MKKTFVFICTLLLLALFQLQAAPGHPGMIRWQGLQHFSKNMPTTNEHGFTRVQAIKPDGSLTYVYARLYFENDYYSGYSLIGDWVVRFYEDNEGQIPAYVSDLVLNYRVIGYNGNNYQWDGTGGATGTWVNLATGVEKDYDDGETYRYMDYVLLPGDYYL